MKYAAHVGLPVILLALGYAETSMQAFAAENAAFVELQLVRVAVGILLGAVLCVCVFAKPIHPVWPAISAALLLILMLCCFLPTGLHRLIPSLSLLAVCTVIEGYTLFKTLKSIKKDGMAR